MPNTNPPRVLIVEAPYYQDIADHLAEGAIAALDAAGATYQRIAVPGALEIPIAIGLAADAGRFQQDGNRGRYDGVVALGCVIRGETTHYETVANESARGLMDIAMRHNLPLGNAILTVENHAQALARAEGGKTSKGADAAEACLRLIALKRQFHEAD